MSNVVLYTKAYCPFCQRAMALLKSKGVKFNELEVDGNPELIAESVKRSDESPDYYGQHFYSVNIHGRNLRNEL